MIQFEIFFKNHFDTDKVSDDNMNRFAQMHIQQLTANNPEGLYTAMLDETQAAYDKYFSAMGTEAHSQSVKEGSTILVDQYMEEFIDLVSMKEGIIKGTWGKKSAEYEEFFPLGLDEYHQATKANIQILMSRFVAAIGNHSGQLPVDFGTQFETVVNNYKNARTTQLNNIGSTDGKRLATKQKRDTLEIQLMKNLLTIAMNNIGNPDAAGVYFDQSIVRKPSHKTSGDGEDEPKPISGPVAPATAVTIMHGGFDANTGFHLVNSGSTVLHFYTANLPDDPVPGTHLELKPDEEVDTYASELGAEANLFLMVYNPNKDNAGSFEVTINEE